MANDYNDNSVIVKDIMENITDKIVSNCDYWLDICRDATIITRATKCDIATNMCAIAVMTTHDIIN